MKPKTSHRTGAGYRIGNRLRGLILPRRITPRLLERVAHARLVDVLRERGIKARVAEEAVRADHHQDI
eukprot:scaffold44193_cov76-Phaeocystis_antarctica.AAC.1